MMFSIRQIALEPSDDAMARLMTMIMQFAVYEQISSIVRAIECSEVTR